MYYYCIIDSGPDPQAAAVKTRRTGHIIPRARQQRGPLLRLLLAVRPSPRNLDHGFTYFPHNPIPCPISDAAAEDVNNNNTAPATMVGTTAIDDGRGVRGRPVCVVLSGLTSVSTPTLRPPPPPPPPTIGRRYVRLRERVFIAHLPRSSLRYILLFYSRMCTRSKHIALVCDVPIHCVACYIVLLY